MAYLVKADDRGRVKLPKGMVSPGDLFLVLPVGRRIVLVKVPPKPVEASSSWLKTEKGRGELRALAEAGALEEVEERLRRRALAGGD
jgi:hypothetical protein